MKSIMKPSTFSLLACLTLAGVTAIAGIEGRSSGGGGNTCHLSFNGTPSSVLLDLISAQGLHQPANPLGQTLSQEILQQPRPGVKIDVQLVRNSMNLAHIESQNILSPELRAEAEFHLSKIERGNLRDQLEFALNNFSFIATSHAFIRPSRVHFESPAYCNNTNTRAVFFYWGTYVFVSVPNWNQLDLTTQAHLLVHETVRAVQSFHHLDDWGLQETTRRILNFQPTGQNQHLQMRDFAGIQSTQGQDFSEALRASDTGTIFQQDACKAVSALRNYANRFAEGQENIRLLQRICRGQEVISHRDSRMGVYQMMSRFASDATDFARPGSSQHRQVQQVLDIAIARMGEFALSGLAEATAPIRLFPRDFVATSINSCARDMVQGCREIKERFEKEILHLTR